MKKVYIHTFGCKVNQYDSQIARDKYERSGYVFADTIEDADIIFINSCTVTAEADRQCRQLARQALKKNPAAKIIVSGCYATRAADEIQGLSPKIEIEQKLNDKSQTHSSAISSFDAHSRAFIKIQDGCDAFCSYCIVPTVRSVMWSKPENEVISEVLSLIKNGYPEIVLSGVRLGRYDSGLTPLLRKLVSLPGNFRLRLSSLELNEVSDELIDIIDSCRDKICAHLHLPLQSGSDKVLAMMKRPYNTSKFTAKIEQVLRRLPQSAITTDVIAGFPGETDKDFESSYRFIENSGISRLHVFRYSSRPGTVAASMPSHIPQAMINERSKALAALDKIIQEHFWTRFMGKTLAVIREGSKNTMLSDNYIRLYCEGMELHNASAVFNVTVFERDGKPWGTVV